MSNVSEVLALHAAIANARDRGVDYAAVRELVDCIFVSQPGSAVEVAARMGVHRLTVMSKRQKFGVRIVARGNKACMNKERRAA